ncbi:aminotransferase class V-fold PLP-dependent enzyme [Facklamia miroungae]|uniref:cysteine desulfurase n=1 Tax=Facklamia miroungae TaxID=120956 RepID=A0A1G7QMY0_9LACT|nr:aminotransferase class V-fold PLP-dependent enzyme [Facklamia miroungae]NKZ28999.1 aminotransferase class V-fold PLP-dependent enzyme [Facklamia miroungae]SDF99833.1 cysteine desulfurase family protein [Facklamia miroungae]
MIYLDNAATSLKKPQGVIDAVVSAIQHSGNAGRGSSETALQASRTIFQARQALNQLINGHDPRQIVFTHNATESLNTVIKGIFNKGDHVISTVMEHNSVLRPLYELEEKGVELTLLSINDTGTIDPEAVNNAIQANTKGMVITHASNVTGDINPIKKISHLLHQHQLLCIVDASQTIGSIPIDVRDLDVDILCFTGHKGLLGPQGTGGIYIRPGISIQPLKSGGTGIDTFSHHQPIDYPSRLEAGTLNSHGIAGLYAGVSYLLDFGVDKIRDYERELLNFFYQELITIPSIKIYGHFDSNVDRCAILSINIGNIDSAIIVEELIDRAEIITRGGGHCAPLMHEALGTREQGVVRFSLSHYTSKEDLLTAVKCLKDIPKDLN